MAPRKASSALVALAFAVMLTLVITFLVREAAGLETPLAAVRGNSMYPLLKEGDIIIVKRPGPNEIAVGDIIVYRSVRGGLIVHRVVGVTKVDGDYFFRTKGDNNPLEDHFLGEYEGGLGVPSHRVVGVAVRLCGYTVKIPYVGFLVIAFSR